MVVRFLLWSLADSQASLDDLRAETLPYTPGAVSETWFSDELSERFGAFAVFRDAAAAAPVPERLRALIGKDPDVVELFDAEGES